MAKQERIFLRAGRIDIESTPDEFPLGKRGQRPLRFTLTDEEALLRVKELDIPGVVIRGMRVDAAWDAARAVCKVIGEPDVLDASLQHRLTCMVPLPGKAKYDAGLISKSRRDYQAEGIRYLLRRAYAILGDPPRCLSGDTKIVVNRAGVGTRMSLRDLHYKFHGGVTWGGRARSRAFTWDETIATYTQSCDEHNLYIRSNRIVDVYESGEKEVFEVITKRGHRLKASADHPFLTPTGWVRLHALRPGAEVYTVVYPRADVKAKKRRKDVTARGELDYIVSISSCGIEMTYDMTMEAPRANFVANEFIVHNSGKCLMILGVAELIAAEKVLIICNSLGKYVWAEEVAKWLGEECVLLFGRAGHEARVFCKACMGRGTLLVNDGVSSECSEVVCKVCNRRGEYIYSVRELAQDTVPRVWNEEPTSDAWERYNAKVLAHEQKIETKRQEHEAKERARYAEWELKNPKRRKPFINREFMKHPSTLPEKPKGQRRVERVPVDGVFRCPRHQDEVDSYERACNRCKAELAAIIAQHRVVVVNYDILSAQKDKDDRGAAIVRADLPGWGPILAKFQFALAVADESHKLRGWQGKGAGGKTSQTRRERANEVCAEIARVFAVTGTPVYGFVRDLWGQLDFVSKGLWS